MANFSFLYNLIVILIELSGMSIGIYLEGFFKGFFRFFLIKRFLKKPYHFEGFLHLRIYVSKFDENGTDRKLRVRAFDWCHFRQIWTSPARDIGDSSLASEIGIVKW